MKCRPVSLLGVAATLLIPTVHCVAQNAQPKRLLVISATQSFRHPSIPNWDIYLRSIEPDFKGQVIMTFMSDAPNFPFSKVPTKSAGGSSPGRGGFPSAAAGTSESQQKAINDASLPLAELNNAVTSAQTALTQASYTGSAEDIEAQASALADATKKLAVARAEAVVKIQASPSKLTEQQLKGLGGLLPMGGGADPAVLASLFRQYTSPEALKNYDGIFFVSTTGVLPFPDEAGFLKWVSEGHGIIGIHAAMDRGDTSDAQMEMLSAGARFNGHPGNANSPSKLIRVDPNFPGLKNFPAEIAVTDEFYSYHWHDTKGEYGVDPKLWIPGVDFNKVHALLNLDRGDGIAFPVAWAKTYGSGRVLYSSLGHRDDVFIDSPSMDYDGLKDNSDEVRAAEKAHIEGGIRWILGLESADVKPGNLKVDPKEQLAKSANPGSER